MTDRHGARPLAESVQRVLDSGCRWVWFRERDLPPGERHALAEPVLAAIRAVGGTLSIGGDADLAAALGADGVHLAGDAIPETVAAARRTLGPRAWIGVSAHSLADVSTAAEGGADYVTLSPIFETASKPGYGPALGLPAIREASRIGIPVVALGGIAPETAAACRAAGAAAVAIMGGVMRAADAARETRLYLTAFRDGGST